MVQPQSIQPELTQAIQGYVRAGYRVIEQTAVSAQLVRPKRFSCLWAVLLNILYVFYFLSKKDETIYLQWDGTRVVTTKGK